MMRPMMPFSKIRTAIIILSIILLSGGVGYRLGENAVSKNGGTGTNLSPVVNTTTPSSATVDFSLFWDVWQRVHRFYIESSTIDNQKLVYGAISGMVNALDDPYTTFFPPKENKEFKDDMGGAFEGIGAQLEAKEGRILVVAPIKGSPAEKAGILAGDWITKVNGEDTFNWTTSQAVSKIRGAKGTPVTLSIYHVNAKEAIDITIIRDTITVPSVETWVKTTSEIKEINGTETSTKYAKNVKKVAYISLSRFGDKLEQDWQKGINVVTQAINTNGSISGLILDLRGNPGGYLDGSVYIGGEFLKEGTTVVSQENSDGTREEYKVDRIGRLLSVPLVVLINKGSASAAEIVAGALRDNGRATIIGETSWGKGSVQTPQELNGGSSVHITTGKWLTPKGDWITKKGIIPDIEVKWSVDEASQDAQLAKAIEFLLK
jgi:carboxyl-terminal processing protease